NDSECLGKRRDGDALRLEVTMFAIAQQLGRQIEDFIADPVHCFGLVCLFADACCPDILSLGRHRTVDRRVFV
ncbi:MAG: hypothetical protein ACPIOQ_64345, partial [Promethearchaeia archaeon]